MSSRLPAEVPTRQGVAIRGVPLRDIHETAHRANVAIARRTPGEQPYVVGWDVLSATDPFEDEPAVDPSGFVLVFDVDDDPALREEWLTYLVGDVELVDVPAGRVLPHDSVAREDVLELDQRSLDAQRARDGVADRFHVTAEAAAAFESEAHAWISDQAAFYRLDSSGVRSYWSASPLAAALRQTLDDTLDGYGGPVGWSVTAVDDLGWRRLTVGALGNVTFTQWDVERVPPLP